MKRQLFTLLFIYSSFLFPQVPEQIQRYRNDDKGNILNRRKGVLDGNRVRTIFQNNGEVSDWFDGAVSAPHFEWPKGTGHRHLDGFTFMVGAKVKIVNTLGQNVSITPIETSYREEMDFDPVTREVWGFEPLPGYSNPNSSSIAISYNQNSWPIHWPAALGLSADWNGQWYGYFGKVVRNDVIETFYVMDDSRDKEFTFGPNSYYPVVSDSARGGLGLRIEVRGMQFTHPLLEDAVIWMYNVHNISDRDYDSTAFGFLADPSVGSVNNDARYDRLLDLSYSWSPAGKGLPNNYKTGYFGYALLETPGNSVNGIDDDGDGLVDERQNDGIDNDGDWVPGTDDVGSDGVAGTSDLGESDGLPTIGEPHFDITDKDESDQIGLQSAYINILGNKGPTGVWPKNDGIMWSVMTGGFTDTAIANANISMVSGSGPFYFKKWSSERLVTAMLCGDDFNDLMINKIVIQSVHNNNFYLPDKLTDVGDIKILTTFPGNSATVSGIIPVNWSIENASHNEISFVYVSRDNINWMFVGADKTDAHTVQWNTADFADGISYSIRVVSIQGSHVGISEIKDVTVNNPANSAPEIYIDNPKSSSIAAGLDSIQIRGGDADGDECNVSVYLKLSSSTPWEMLSENLKFNNKRIVYYWDTKKYPNSFNSTTLLKGIVTSNFDTTYSSIVSFQIKNEWNTFPIDTLTESRSGNATGKIELVVPDLKAIKSETYHISFTSATFADSIDVNIKNNTTGEIKLQNYRIGLGTTESPLIDNIRFRFLNDKMEIDKDGTGWNTIDNIFSMAVDYDSAIPSLNVRYPYDYEIHFADHAVDTTIINDPPMYPQISVPFYVKNSSRNQKNKFIIQDMDSDGKLSIGDTIRILEDFQSISSFKIITRIGYGKLNDVAPSPKSGDIFYVKTKKPFSVNDTIVVSTEKLTSVEEIISTLPTEYSLAQNYPNPFNPITNIQFSIPQNNFVTIKIFNILGKEIATVVNEYLQHGSYQVKWDGSGISSGVYFYRLTSGNFVATKKLILLK